MRNQLMNKKKGFTIIEVIIVLAIAALIIVVVLLAVAGLQRGQRDKARQDAAGRVMASIQQIMADTGNGGQLVNGQDLGLVATNFSFPSNTPNLNAQTTVTVAAAPTTVANVIYGVGGVCSGGTGTGTFSLSSVTGNTQRYAVAYWNEGAGKSQCIGAGI